MIRLIEEISMNAWPCFETFVYDGWILRFAGGYTRRSNSVYPLYNSNLDIKNKIKECEKLYRERNLKVIFKITSASLPDNLDTELELRGYKTEAESSVQLANLSNLGYSGTTQVKLDEQLTDDWLNAYCRMHNITGKDRTLLEHISNSIILDRRYASIEVNGQIDACGLGVLQDGYIGLFEIVTDKSFRQKGYGAKIVEGLLSWGKRNDAHTAYLQVMANNVPALKLYEKLGFKEEYRYWYRVLD